MPISIHKKSALLFAGILLLSGCSSCDDSEPECRTRNQCKYGELCVDGQCQTSVDSNSEAESDSADTGTVPDTSSATGSDSGIDTSTDMDTDENCLGKTPSLESGQNCTSSCDCFSGHCSNGFCCDSGVCCGESGDCPDAACSTSHCVASTCISTFGEYGCGSIDLSEGNVCHGANVCNGTGECIVAAKDCTPYATKTDGANCAVSPAQVTCYDSCNDANATTNCGPASVCKNGKCVLVTGLANGSACSVDGNCLSAHCGNGFCCQSGECCSTSADCGDMCVLQVACGENFQCTILDFMGCGQSDAQGNDTCSSAGQKCDGHGNCRSVEACRTDNGLLSYRCENGAVVQDCGCTTNDDCDDDTEYCNDGYLCIEDICEFSSKENPCPSNPCRSGVQCEEAARACTTGTNPCDAVAIECDPLNCVASIDNQYSCLSNPDPDGFICDDGVGCNGTIDFCLDGTCVPGGESDSYCFDSNPCGSSYSCVENNFGQAPSCDVVSTKSTGDNCLQNFSCYGTEATCQPDPQGGNQLLCIQSEEVCMSNGICDSYTCSEDWSFGSDTGYDCTGMANNQDISTITCNNPTVTIAVADGKFSTRSYFNYSAACNGIGDVFVGKETRIYMELGQAVTNATLSVSSIDPAFTGSLELLLFDSNPCSETNCILRGTNTLTFSSTDGYEIVVLDSVDSQWPPETVTLQLNCNL